MGCFKKREMGYIKNLVSVVLFLVDLGTDIYVAVKHHQNGDETFFILSVVFIVGPFIIGIAVACFQQVRAGNELENTLVYARYIEAMYESAPQWCLQVYIMLLQWEFPWYTILSTVVSLLSLTWSTIQIEIQTAKDGYDNEILAVVVFFFHGLSGFTSRLVAIAVFAYVFGLYLFAAAFLGHSLVLVAILYCMERNILNNYLKICKCLGESAYCFTFFVISYLLLPVLLHPSKAVFVLFQDDEDRLKTYYAWIYTLIVAGNIIMLTLVVALPPQEVTHMDVVGPLAMGCVIGGTIMNLIVLICRKTLLNKF